MKEVSPGVVRVFFALKQRGIFWVSLETLSGMVEGITPTTVRAICRKFAEEGIAEEERVYPAYMYRLRACYEQHNPELVTRLDRTAEVLGIRYPVWPPERDSAAA